MSDGDLLPIITAARNQLRDCYWWRRLADANSAWDEATSAAHIHLDELPPPAGNAPDHSRLELVSLRPFAIMWADISGGFRWRADSGDYCCSVSSGTIIIQIEMNVPANLAATPTALALDIHQKFGRIIRTADDQQPGLLDLSGQPGYLPIIEAHISGYIRTDRKAAIDIGDAVTAEIELKWGVTQ